MTNKGAFGAPSKADRIILEKTTLESLAQYELGDTIGSFYGFLRRAKATKQGLTAQVFGENGNDADFITTLHLTRYLDACVKVSVWMVKDASGKLFNENGKNPLLSEFIGTIKRPLPSDAGQTAQFFGINGINADSINQLNESRYQDALVLVEIQKATPGMMADEIKTLTPEEELESGKGRLTEQEESKLKKQQKKAESALALLRQVRFFENSQVLSAIGTQSQYTKWISSQPCCHPMEVGVGSCQNGPCTPFEVHGSKTKAMSFVPFCSEHIQIWQSEVLPELGSAGPHNFLKTQNRIYVQRWAQETLCRVLNVPIGYLPSPSLIYNWVLENRLQSALPVEFKMFID